MNDKNDMVLIQLDQPRELRFSNKALKEYSALTGTDMNSLDASLLSFENQISAAHILLKHDAIRNGEKPMTRERVEDLLDEHVKPGKLFYLLNRALELAFRDEEMEAQIKARQEAQETPPEAAGTGENS